MVQSKLVRRTSGPTTAPPRPAGPARAFSADLAHRPNRRDLWRVTVKPDEEDVIDLGAPRKVRVGRSLGPAPPRPVRAYTPNPRLYPGPQKPAQVKQKQKPSGPRRQRKKTTFRRPVPNSRLYRPAPPRPSRPPPPPAYPRTVWKPPAQGTLETASRVALRLSHGLWSPPLKRPSENTIIERPPSRPTTRRPKRPTLRTRRSPTASPTRRLRSPTASPTRRLRSPTASPTRRLRSPPRFSPSRPQTLHVTLPAAGDGKPPSGQSSAHSQNVVQYKPASQHFRDRQARPSRDSTPVGGRYIQLSNLSNMDSTPRHSTSPEDCSEGNDSHSAPSEFLAEFLSAIMRRQYAEALKYCRLILQYEPRNATARGFYPLLQQKLAQQSPRDTRKAAPRARRHRSPRGSRSPDLAGGSSGGNSGESSPVPPGVLHEVMEQEADSLSRSGSGPGSAGGSSASGLDSVSSQSSLELDESSPSPSLSRRTDRTDSPSGTWDSAGSRDDNGNPAPPTEPRPCCDAENNQPAPAPPPPAARARPLTLQSEQSTESLRRLRAQFACSIK